MADPGFKEDKWVRIGPVPAGGIQSVVHHIIVFIAPPKWRPHHRNQKRQPGSACSSEGQREGVNQLRRPRPHAFVARAKKARRLRSHPETASNQGNPAQPEENPAKTSNMRSLVRLRPGNATIPRAGRHGQARARRLEVYLPDALHAEWTRRKKTAARSACSSSTRKRQVPPGDRRTQPTSDFEIPAEADDHKVESQKSFAQDTLFIGMYPHMHMRGKTFRYELTYPDGKKEVLLDVPRYDFNWQNWFKLQKPLVIPAGSNMLCTASLRQFGKQSLQSGSVEARPLGRSDLGRNDDRLVRRRLPEGRSSKTHRRPTRSRPPSPAKSHQANAGKGGEGTGGEADRGEGETGEGTDSEVAGREIGRELRAR